MAVINKKYAGKLTRVPAVDDECPECGSIYLEKDNELGEICCKDCGLVVQDKLTRKGYDWRAFDSGEEQERRQQGSPGTYTLHDKGLSTGIDLRDLSKYGKTMEKRLQILRLKKWNDRSRVQSATERNLAYALDATSRIIEHLKLPKYVKEEAALLYRRAVKQKLVRGRSIIELAAASVYYINRERQLGRSIEEVAAAAAVPKLNIARNYRFLHWELDLKSPVRNPRPFVTRYGNKLQFSGNAQKVALRVVEVAEEVKLTSGRDPSSIATAALYIASILTNFRKTQKEIAEVANVTEVTIRNRYKEMVEKLLFEVAL